MPLYEYQCDSCQNRFEKIQKSYNDPPLETCPKCGKGPVRKLISSPAIQFKGTGWYITDYAKKSSADGGQTGSNTAGGSEKSEKSEKSDKAEKSDKGESKSDAKADAKSDSSTLSSTQPAAKTAKTESS